MIGVATRHPAVVWATSVMVVLAGGVSFSRLPLATRTTVELPQLAIAASWMGASAEVVETYLTSPIEAAVQGVRGVHRVNSDSQDNVCTLRVELDADADVQITRLAILERLQLLRADFPPGASQPYVSNYVPSDLEEQPLLQLSIVGPYTPGTLQKLLRDQVQPRLSSVTGVAGVGIRGGTNLGVSVSYDPVLLRSVGVSPGTLRAVLDGARVVGPLGTVQGNGGVKNVVMRDQPGNLEALTRLPVRGPGTRTFRLGDLADVRSEEDSRGSFFRINGEPAVVAEVYRHPGADAIKTVAALREAIGSVTRDMPVGVRLQISNDESEELTNELRDLTRRGVVAFVGVLVVLTVMLRQWRTVALITGSTAVAIAGTALGLYLFDVPANMLTLAGLGMGVGILVQNAIVVANRLGTMPDTPDGRAAATRRIAPAVIGSTLTSAVVLLPFLYLQGDARAAFVPFATAFLLALLWSVYTALIVVPALGHGAAVRRSLWPRSRTVYIRLLSRALRWRWLILSVAVTLLSVSGWGFVRKVPRRSFSGFGERRTTLSASLEFPRGSDPDALERAMRDFESIVQGRSEVEQVRTIGYSGTSARMSVLFTYGGGLTSVPRELQELLTQRAVLIGGATVSVHGTGPGFSAGFGSGALASFRIRVLGYSYDGVTRVAQDLKARLERLARVRDVKITAGGAYYGGGEHGYQVTLEPSRAALAHYGLTATDFRNAVARVIRGPVGSQRIEIGGEELPVTLKTLGARDRTLLELQDALVSTPLGAPVRIGQLARVDAREALSQVSREDQQYVRVVAYDFRGPQQLAQRTHDAFFKAISVPPGYSVDDPSQHDGRMNDESSKGLWLVFALGIALVILSVACVFDSVWGAAMVFLSLPFALGGVAAAFWIMKTAFTREAAVGVILVVGLAVHQAILLVDAAIIRRRVERLRGDGIGASSALDAGQVLRAALDRAGMIALTTLSSLASLVPLSIGTDATQMFGAIALATAGGTVAGTIGAMFVVPVLLVGRRRTPRSLSAR